MALLKSTFYKQVSLATISKIAKNKLNIGESMEFWEADVIFKINKADFSFEVREPQKRDIIKKTSQRLEYSPLIAYETNPPKRFWTKEEADIFILFNIIQIYKPLKNYIKAHGIDEQFDKLLEDHPEKFLLEHGKGKNWLID